MKTFLFALLCAGSLALCGCKNPSPGEAPATGKAVNARCPISSEPVVATVTTTTFQGQIVGFCCPDCVPAWNKLSDSERAAKLAAAKK